MAAPPIPRRPAPSLPADRGVPTVPARQTYHSDGADPPPSRPAPPINCRPFPPNPGPRSTSLRNDPTSPKTAAKRSRPVITVVAARPMDEVGFRDVSERPTPTSPSQTKKSQTEANGTIAKHVTDENGLISVESGSPPPGKPAIPQRSASTRHSMVAKPTEHDPEESVCEKPLPVPPRPAAKPRAISMLVKLPPTIIKPKPPTTQHGEVTAFVNEGFNLETARSDTTPTTEDQDDPGQVMLIDFDAKIPPLPSPRASHSTITKEETIGDQPVCEGVSQTHTDVDQLDMTTAGQVERGPSSIDSLKTVATPLAFLNKRESKQTLEYHKINIIAGSKSGLSTENGGWRTDNNIGDSRSSEFDTTHVTNCVRNDVSETDNSSKRATRLVGVAVLPTSVSPTTERLH